MVEENGTGREQPATAHLAPWPRPSVSFGAILEAAGPWWLVATAGMLVLLAALASVQRLEGQRLQDARLELTLQEVRERLEADLAIGFELGASSRAQPLLEDTLARDPSLLAVEVFDAGGVSLFSTDRGAIGEPVPPAWRAAVAQAGHGDATAGRWSVQGDDDTTLGLPIRGAFGEGAGHVSATALRVPPPPRLALVAAAVAAWAALSLLALALVRRALARSLPDAASDPLAPCARRLAQAQRRMDATLSSLAEEGAAP